MSYRQSKKRIEHTNATPDTPHSFVRGAWPIFCSPGRPSRLQLDHYANAIGGRNATQSNINEPWRAASEPPPHGSYLREAAAAVEKATCFINIREVPSASLMQCCRRRFPWFGREKLELSAQLVGAPFLWTERASLPLGEFSRAFTRLDVSVLVVVVVVVIGRAVSSLQSTLFPLSSSVVLRMLVALPLPQAAQTLHKLAGTQQIVLIGLPLATGLPGY